MDRPRLIVPLSARDGLRLEPVSPGHVDALFRLVDEDRDRLGRWLPWVDGTRQREDTSGFVTAMVAAADPDTGTGAGAWALRPGSAAGTDEAPVVGVAGLHDVSVPHRRVSIGYWIGGRYEGTGLVTRAVAAVVAHVHSCGVHRVEIRAAVDNARSRRIPERLGFTFEGVARGDVWIRGQPVDQAVYSRLPEAPPGSG